MSKLYSIVPEDISGAVLRERLCGSLRLRQKRRGNPIRERRNIVEETLVPGASVARVTRRHEVNANQVFYWRKLYREGRLGITVRRRCFLFGSLTGEPWPSVSMLPSVWEHSNVPTLPILFDYSHSVERVTSGTSGRLRRSIAILEKA